MSTCTTEQVGRVVRALRLGQLAELEGDGMECASVAVLLQDTGRMTDTASFKAPVSVASAVPGPTPAAPAPTSASL